MSFSTKKISEFLKIKKFGIKYNFRSSTISRLLELKVINALYQKNKNLKEEAFCEAVLSDLGVQYEISVKELRKLPKDGAYITISNHPMGMVEYILLIKLMLDKTDQYKLLTDLTLHNINALQPFSIPLNHFENHKTAKSKIATIKHAMTHLKSNKPLGLFPFYHSSTCSDIGDELDRMWDHTLINFIKKAEVPVVPIYFHESNRRLFYFLSAINNTLNIKLSSEKFSNNKRILKVRIGKPISVNEQNKCGTMKVYANFLRVRTYLLGKSFCTNNDFVSKKQLERPFVDDSLEIVAPADQEKVKKEIDLLKTTKASLFKSGQYEVFFSNSSEIPEIVYELGRLREITFRKIGEGTSKAIDLDKYDSYYHHLILWDNDAQKIGGAYRIGVGDEIYKKYGISGFYLSSTFDFDERMHEFMSHSLELGRAFIVAEYQRKTLPLMLLWSGVTRVAQIFPQHKYLIGSVSISNMLSEFSKTLIIEFLKHNYLDQSKNCLIHAKQDWKSCKDKTIEDLIENHLDNNLETLDTIIAEIESGHWKVPVLIKKYIDLSARVLSFNVDPDFNNAIDVLMYIRIQDIVSDPHGKIKAR